MEWLMMARIFGAAIVSRSFPCNLVGDPLRCCKNFVICCGTWVFRDVVANVFADDVCGVDVSMMLSVDVWVSKFRCCSVMMLSMGILLV